MLSRDIMMEGDIMKIDYLMRKKANPNIECEPMKVPLTYAAESKYFELVKLLLKYGADPCICQRELTNMNSEWNDPRDNKQKLYINDWKRKIIEGEANDEIIKAVEELIASNPTVELIIMRAVCHARIGKLLYAEIALKQVFDYKPSLVLMQVTFGLERELTSYFEFIVDINDSFSDVSVDEIMKYLGWDKVVKYSKIYYDTLRYANEFKPDGYDEDEWYNAFLEIQSRGYQEWKHAFSLYESSWIHYISCLQSDEEGLERIKDVIMKMVDLYDELNLERPEIVEMSTGYQFSTPELKLLLSINGDERTSKRNTSYNETKTPIAMENNEQVFIDSRNGKEYLNTKKHPCVRAYGSCNNEKYCKYRNYPYQCCLRYLKNKCTYDKNCEEPHLEPKMTFDKPIYVKYNEKPRDDEVDDSLISDEWKSAGPLKVVKILHQNPLLKILRCTIESCNSDRCIYAHSEEEKNYYDHLRSQMKHPCLREFRMCGVENCQLKNVKMMTCLHYLNTKTCRRGDSCFCIHNDEYVAND